MICTVKDGRYHGRRRGCVFATSCIRAWIPQMFDLKQSVPAWVAHASRVLVSASRRNELCRGVQFAMEMGEPEKSSRSRGHNRQHARRVRYPETCAPLSCVLE